MNKFKIDVPLGEINNFFLSSKINSKSKHEKKRET